MPQGKEMCVCNVYTTKTPVRMPMSINRLQFYIPVICYWRLWEAAERFQVVPSPLWAF